MRIASQIGEAGRAHFAHGLSCYPLGRGEIVAEITLFQDMVPHDAEFGQAGPAHGFIVKPHVGQAGGL